MYYTNFDAHLLYLQREEIVELMNSTRFRCWFLSVPITIVVVGYMVALAMVTGHDTSSIYAIIGLIGFFVLVGGIFGGEKFYQKYKDKLEEKRMGYSPISPVTVAVPRMATQLTPEEMKVFVRQHFEDFVNNKKAEVIRRNMTPDFYDHDGPGDKPAGVEEDEKMMRRMYDLMPDLQITIENMVAEGDKVVCRNSWHWKDPTSGTLMEFHGFVQWRFEGNQIAERWATVTEPREADE